eukprot:s1252_g7.t1
MQETEDLESHTKHLQESEEYKRGMQHKRALEVKSEAESAEESEHDPSEGVCWSRSTSRSTQREPSVAVSSSSSRASKRIKVELKSKAEVKAKPKGGSAAGPSNPLSWRGGHGKHGTLKEPKGKMDVPSALIYLGGMRDPHRAVVKLPTLQAQGAKLWERWRKFACSHRDAWEVAESYGTANCKFNTEVVDGWRRELCDLWGIEVPGPRQVDDSDYSTPVYYEMLKAWTSLSGDPDGVVCKWLKEGAPLGIEMKIETAGVFPPIEQEAEGDDLGVKDQVIADAVLERPDSLKNYKSVEDDLEEAEIELQRYEDLGYLVRVSREAAEQQYKDGTVSRLGLVLKVKDSGIKKRRIVIDMRRSGGNAKSELPERLVLPRLTDAVKLMKEVRKRSTRESDPDDEDEMEMALVDVSDAFTVLPVAPAERKHTLAPSTRQDECLVFRALLFGYKVAPLLYSRFAALVARLLQSAVKLNRGGHEVYLDDSLWILQGPLATRTNTLAFILNTMAALGLRVSLGKGSRANKATWIGVSLHFIDKNTLVLGLPEKFIEDLLGILKRWEGMGYAPLKELRVVAGKNAWLGGVLPRARWTTSVFYAVLSQTLKEEEGEKGPTTRNRKGLFAVKRLELARRWLISFLTAAKLRPMRRISLLQASLADIRITTDASPEALGGILTINGRIVAAYVSPVEKAQRQSSSQGVLEALAILVALRRWTEKVKGLSISIVVQSDSITALALSQKLSAKSTSPGLNFIGAELSICIEELAVEELKSLHVPGKANVEADWLSRPSSWDSVSKPAGLVGIDADLEIGPNSSFYRLPTPKAAPSLWGVKEGAAGGTAIWDAVA